MEKNDEDISTFKTVLYGMPNISMSVITLPMAIYLPIFYSESVGLPFALVGMILFFSRLTDVISDPLVGILSDKWNTRIGRRKPWIIAGVPFLAISIWMMYRPPEGATVWYLLMVVVMVYLADTMVNLPYRAWGSELATDYHKRSRVTGLREIFGLVGTIVALLVPRIMETFGYTGIAYNVLGVAIATAILLPSLMAIALAFVPERPPEKTSTKEVELLAGLKIVWRNGPFRRLLSMALFFTIAITMTATLSRLFVMHGMHASSLDYIDVILVYYTSSFLCIPLWMMLAKRVGKHKALAAAIVWLSIWSSVLPFLNPDPYWLFVVIMVLKGSSMGALIFLPASMAADVIDLDTLRSGEQRTGLYFSIWGMMLKTAAAGAILLATSAAGWVGFDPRCSSHPGQEATTMHLVEIGRLAEFCTNSPSSVFWIACLYSVIPAFLALACIPALWSYPITEERQKRMRERIERRNRAVASEAPVLEIGRAHV